MRDHGGAMIVIGLPMPISFMLQLQIWIQLTVLMLVLNILQGEGKLRQVKAKGIIACTRRLLLIPKRFTGFTGH